MANGDVVKLNRKVMLAIEISGILGVFMLSVNRD